MRRLAFLLASLAVSACGDVARLKVELRFTDSGMQQSIQQLLFVARQPPASGDPCAPLWGTPPSNLGQYARLIDYPNPEDIVAAPLKPDTYTLFFYGFASRIDTLCQGDNDCSGSAVGPSCRVIAGGQKGCLPTSANLPTVGGGCGQDTVDDTSGANAPTIISFEAAP
ncbi:MAG: hypothetical protein U1E65_11845 [Myxococcota bacterium]